MPWTRPLTNDDFRQLCHHMLCWRITGKEGLEHVLMLDYQIYINGLELLSSQGNFYTRLLNLLETRKVTQLVISKKKEKTSCELAPILIRFLRPEIAILGADLHKYEPFRIGDVVALPFVYAWVFIQNGSPDMFCNILF